MCGYYIMSTLEKKISISAGSALMFGVLNLPAVYEMTNRVLPVATMRNGCPTSVGLLVHTFVFLGLTYLTMCGAKMSDGMKLSNTIFSALIFYFLSSKAMYSMVGKVIGSNYSNSSGCHTMSGAVVHALVYCAALVGVMYLE